MFSQRHQSREVQASVLQRKAIVNVAGGLRKLCVQGLTPSPSALVSKPEKGAEDTKAAGVRLSEIPCSSGSEGREEGVTWPRLGSLQP